jgi:hypothetical protein
VSVQHARAPGLADLPGLRTFRSRSFRVLVALLLAGTGVVVIVAALATRAAMPLETGQFGIDLADYLAASRRLVESGSPYEAAMLEGPVAAQGLDRYRYPPPFAQLLVPVAGAQFPVVAGLWAAVQFVALVAAVWLAGSAAGLRSGAERALWSVVAVVCFVPVFDALWKGNVSGLLAVATAVMLSGDAAAGAGGALGSLLKVSPAVHLPALLSRNARTAAMAAATLAGVIAVSVALSPTAWRDYSVVLPNLLAGSSDYANNLAPHAVAQRLGAPDWLENGVRLGAVVASGLLVLLSVWCARSGRWPAAVTAGSGAALLLPAALWYHYLVVLLPLAAAAWARADGRARAALLLGGGLVSTIVLAPLGAIVMYPTILAVLLRTPTAAEP